MEPLEPTPTASDHGAERAFWDFGRLLPRVVAVLGVSLGVLYAIGFLVANSYYGTFWLVEPSLLQARYAAAGVLWLVFVSCSLVPAHYGIEWWGVLRSAMARSAASPQPASEGRYARVIDWVTQRHVAVRWLLVVLLGVPLTLVVWAAAIFLMSFFVVVPSFVVVFLVGVGATVSSVLLPTVAFHWAVLLYIFLAKWAGMTLDEALAFRREPHRALLLAAMVCLHAVMFGKFVYPLVPPSGGGGQPLAIRMTLTEPLPGASGVVGGTRNSDGSTTFDRAYLVGQSEAFLVVLLPKAVSDSTGRFYCPVAVRRDNVAMVQVRTPMIPVMAPIPTMGPPSRITDLFVPGPLVWNCR